MGYNNSDKFFNHNFFVRAISTIGLAPIVLYIIYRGGFLYYMTICIVAILMAFEWGNMLSPSKVIKHRFIWKLVAVFYTAIPCSSLIWISVRDSGNKVVMWLILTVWITDIMAYLVGRSVGGPKLLTKISPTKTWSGLIGGCFSAVVFGYGASLYLNSRHPEIFILLTASISIYAQIGDLIESWIKRIFEIKDSGNLIPGHGGVLDRVDGIILTAPKIAIILYFDHWQLL
jgi:phosphatidate cytidylyltransferase